MSELVALPDNSREPSPPVCGLIHPAEATTRLTTMSLDLLVSALQHDGQLPDCVGAGNGKQWRVEDAGIDVFVDLKGPLGKEIDVEDLSRQPSLVGASGPS